MGGQASAELAGSAPRYHTGSPVSMWRSEQRRDAPCPAARLPTS